MNMNWFEVHKEGLSSQMEGRPKSAAVFELIANAWDSGSDRVDVRIEPIENSPFVNIEVEDFGCGFQNIEDAYVMFTPSTSAGDDRKRGRFAIGEKHALALCRRAEIITTTGSVIFDDSGRHRGKKSRDQGTLFKAEMRIKRDELAMVEDDLSRLIPPVITTYNGQVIEASKPVAMIKAKLSNGYAEIDLHEGPGEVLELGIPVVEAEIGFRANVLRKVPLNRDRDNVQPGWLRSLKVAIVNTMAKQLTEEQVTETWVQEAKSDSRITPEAFGVVHTKQFGERSVVAVPGDPMANASAEAAGYTVVHGGSMSQGAWANAKKFGSMKTTSQVFPTPKAEVLAALNAAKEGKCPTCGRELE
jgi:hypothetical protein